MGSESDRTVKAEQGGHVPNSLFKFKRGAMHWSSEETAEQSLVYTSVGSE